MSLPKSASSTQQLTGLREWIASRDALRLVTDAYVTHDIEEYDSKEKQRCAAMAKAANAIIRRLTEGTLLSRPVWFRFVQGSQHDASEHVINLHEQDRAISPNFWRTMQRLRAVAVIDWVAGDFSFEDSDAGVWANGHACGVKFDLSGLPALDLPYPKQTQKAGGAPRKWDWDSAVLHLAVLAHESPDGLLREDGGNPNQSDIARHLRAWFIDTCDNAPEDSQLRDYGKRFVAELNAVKLRAAKNVLSLE